MWWFTSDEHYGHENIIKYCYRSFESVGEMDYKLISNHNAVVKPGDVVYHLGDFTLKKDAHNYISRLNGTHVFIKGSHDRWLSKSEPYIREIKIEKQNVVLCHYAMRRWAKSHHGSWQLYGHSHGHLPPEGKQWDVGVDNNNYYPVSWDKVKKIMEQLPDNEENHPNSRTRR